MTKEQFLGLYSSYHGEPVDNTKQLVKNVFSGDELYDFCKFIVDKSLPSPAMVVEDGCKCFEIDFGCHVRCGVKIKNNTPEVTYSIDGWGNEIPINQVKINPLT